MYAQRNVQSNNADSLRRFPVKRVSPLAVCARDLRGVGQVAREVQREAQGRELAAHCRSIPGAAVRATLEILATKLGFL